MENNFITDWSDYWHLFDEFVNSLQTNNQSDIAEQIKSTQGYVNGLTDGWYEFLNAFKDVIETNKKRFDNMQIKTATLLIEVLSNSLNIK